MTNSPTLLLGAQRSGTTALGLALAEGFARVGGRFTVNGRLPYLLRRWWLQSDADAQHLRGDEVATQLYRKPAIGVGSDIWLDRAVQSVMSGAREAASDHIEVKEAIRRVCVQAYGVQNWGDKYNEYLIDLPWLLEIFPDAKWIFLYRSPSAAVSSMLNWEKQKIWNPETSYRASQKWTYWNSIWLDNRLKIPRQQMLELNYEDICAGITEPLSSFVGLEMGEYLRNFKAQTKSNELELTMHPDAVSVFKKLKSGMDSTWS